MKMVNNKVKSGGRAKSILRLNESKVVTDKNRSVLRLGVMSQIFGFSKSE